MIRTSIPVRTGHGSYSSRPYIVELALKKDVECRSCTSKYKHSIGVLHKLACRSFIDRGIKSIVYIFLTLALHRYPSSSTDERNFDSIGKFSPYIAYTSTLTYPSSSDQPNQMGGSASLPIYCSIVTKRSGSEVWKGLIRSVN
jgi:hypothetical protein